MLFTLYRNCDQAVSNVSCYGKTRPSKIGWAKTNSLRNPATDVAGGCGTEVNSGAGGYAELDVGNLNAFIECLMVRGFKHF